MMSRSLIADVLLPLLLLMAEAEHEHQPLLRPEDVDATPVYPIIHMIKQDVMNYIDTPLTYEALTTPDLVYTLVRPLVEKYLVIQRDGNLSITFCCLINRVHFLRDGNLTTATLSRSRAHLCEILAIRVFRENAKSMLLLTVALTTSWHVWSGADPIISQAREEKDEVEDRVGNAIEMAILGKAKKFIKSSSCQKVIDGIWSGRCVYQAQSAHSILSDTYKRTPVHFYDPHKAPLLDHYRLKVPSIRSVLDYLNFLLLFVLFFVALEYNQQNRLNAAEICFMIFALGFSLEKVATMQEHGIKVYFKGTWNGFDLAFVTTFFIYGFLRLYGVYYHHNWAASLGIDVLALIACLMFPRFAFVTFENNLLVLSLRAMIMQFVFLMVIATFCFCGFLYALWTLSRDQAHYSLGLIAWWMLDLWFGLDASGFDKATSFHPVFGPVLMVTYACLSNTLLLTVLVSILSNTFASVNEDAAAEAMFRKAVATIEGVKADSLFSYQLPVNLIALCIMLPASYILSPRWFHKVNVFMIRVTSFPILLFISFYERQAKLIGAITFYETVVRVAEKVLDKLPRSLRKMTFFEGLVGVDADIDAVFDIEEEFDSALDVDNNDGFSIRNQGPPSSQKGVLTSVPLGKFTTTMSAQSYSPLAQVYNPVVVDDNTEDPSNPGHSAQPVISYGPATRRRFTPVHKRSVEFDQAHSTQLRQFPTIPMTNINKFSPPAHGVLRSHTEDRYLTSQSSSVPQSKASEMSDDEQHPPRSEFMQRLDDIERRQERIESLLVRISQNISSNTG